MSSVLAQVFLGGADPKGTRDRLIGIVNKALQDRTLELEAIIHGSTGEGNEEISNEQFLRILAFLRSVAERHEDGESVYLNINANRNNIRATIDGDEAIGDYCIEDILPPSTTFMQKRRVIMPGSKKGEKPQYYEYRDYGIGYRVNLKMEDGLRNEDPMVRELRGKWRGLMKTYRLIQRESFYVGMFRIDCSRVRQGRGRTIEESGVLDKVPSQEVEIELIKDRIGDSRSPDNILKSLFKNVLRTMRIIRNSWFLTREEKSARVIQEYATMTGQSGSPKFIGPMPITLSRSYLKDLRSGHYTATLKADGERALMLILKNGEVFLMYRTLRIQDTGMIVKFEGLRNTILDGEVIMRIKDPETDTFKMSHKGMFMIFDCYRMNGRNIHTLPLFKAPEGGESRLGVASTIADALGGVGAFEARWGNDTHVMSVTMKEFVMLPPDSKGMEAALTSLDESVNMFHTDGYVFTPNNKAVNNCRGDELSHIRGTWDDVMKWKPPEDNTVDFLLKLNPEKMESEPGKFYKEGELYVYGSNMSPDVLYDLQNREARDIARELRSRENMAVPFYGGDHRIQLDLDEGGAIIAKSGDIVEDGMIIECVWNSEKRSVKDDKTGGWEIRNVRHDKTAMYRTGKIAGTMNADRTAKSVWDTTVSDPLAKSDLWEDGAMYTDSPDGGDDDTGGYFNSKGKREESVLARMRDFHNLVVKKYLISPNVKATSGKKIVDLACGKGGDIPRYQNSKASFVFGLDIVPDNILNLADGAIRRYIGLKSRSVKMRFALADCGKDISAPDTAGDDQSREIIAETFSTKGLLGSGADRVVCMFAMHYFFKNPTVLDTYFRNVSRILRPRAKDDPSPPCFVSCYFDAVRVHNLLKEKGEVDDDTGNVVYRSFTADKKLAWYIEGLYDMDSIPEGESPEETGLEIKVYISSINKAHNEYLVGRNTFKSVCEAHGMRVVEAGSEMVADAKKCGYAIAGNTFDRLFSAVTPKSRAGKALDMTPTEKELSFLYRWDIVLKV